MENSFWDHVKAAVGEREKRLRVLTLLLKYGFSVRGDEVYVGEKVKVSLKSIAEEAGVDRRTVLETLRAIGSDSLLKEFFEKLRPAGPSLVSVSRVLGYRCLVIEVHEDRPGILAWVASALAEKGINILQVVAEDPNIYQEPKLYVVVSQDIPEGAVNKILQHPAIKRVTIS
ncbi:MAG: ACT domain-containing protein [Thermofilum sp.]